MEKSGGHELYISARHKSTTACVETHHDVAGKEICSCQDYHNKPDGKHQPSDCSYEARSVLLVPRRGICAQQPCASEAQQRACHERVEEQFVYSHVGFLAAYSRDKLDGLLSSEGVHLQYREKETQNVWTRRE